MRFSPSLIERLRSAFLVSEVIARRMPLKKHGREHHGLCPFHNEKTPSFTVNDDKGFFHCFGCGAHGDSIEFVRKFDRISYADAVENLAREAGIEIAKPNPDDKRKIEREKNLYDVLEAACCFFEKQLLAPCGMLAKDYIENRGIRSEAVMRFRIGYAPKERDALYKYLHGLGFSKEMQVAAGLITVTDSGSVYDRFRQRVIFPIRNVSGKVIAFGGRLISGDGENKNAPKYLNSPETSLFKKGEVLFNLDQAKKVARDGNMVVVMEGYMDVVISAQSGINYAVATLGTAVTPEHLRLLWQLAQEPILCLDADAAGKRAMMRAADIALPLLKPNYSLRYAVLPQGEDPDSYVQKQGKTGFEKIMLSSRRLSQFLWDNLLPKYNLELPEGRAALDDACKQLAGKIEDNTVRQHYLSHFRSQLYSHSGRKANSERSMSAKKSLRSVQIEQMMAQNHTSSLEQVTEKLLTVLLKHPELLRKSSVEEVLSRLDIKVAATAALRDILLQASTNSMIDDADSFYDYVNNNLVNENISRELSAALNHNGQENKEGDEAFSLWNEYVAVYEIALLEHEFYELQQNLGQFTDEDDYLRMVELKEEVKKARARRSFAPSESDVA